MRRGRGCGWQGNAQRRRGGGCQWEEEEGKVEATGRQGSGARKGRGDAVDKGMGRGKGTVGEEGIGRSRDQRVLAVCFE